MLEPEAILSIPLDRFMSRECCTVVVWVTNNPAFHRFVVEKLFPRFGIQYCATWHWLKVRWRVLCSSDCQQANSRQLAKRQEAKKAPYRQNAQCFFPPSNFAAGDKQWGNGV